MSFAYARVPDNSQFDTLSVTNSAHAWNNTYSLHKGAVSLYYGFFVTKITRHRKVTKVAVRMYSSYLSQPIIYIGMDKKCRSDEQLECS